MLCHEMLDTLFEGKIALCDAGVGIGKTHAYLAACLLWQRFRPVHLPGTVVISTSSIALQGAIMNEYIPFLSRVFLQAGILEHPICAVVRKGKERFVCEARLAERMAQVCALPGFVDSKNEEKTERNAGYLVVSHSGGGMLRQGTRKGIRRTPANRGMRAHWVVKGLDISEDVCHGMCP